MPTTRSAALLGASGLIGGFCLKALLADVSYTGITVMGRRQLDVPPNPRLTQKIADLGQLVAKDFVGIDDVFCALGTTRRQAGSKEAFRRVDLEFPVAAARAAQLAGARQFVLVSSVGAESRSGNFYLRTKGEVEERVKQAGFNSVHIFRPSLLLGKRSEFRMGERVMAVLSPVLNLPMVGPLRKYKAIAAESVGKAMVAAARKAETGTLVYYYDEIMSLASS